MQTKKGDASDKGTARPKNEKIGGYTEQRDDNSNYQKYGKRESVKKAKDERGKGKQRHRYKRETETERDRDANESTRSGSGSEDKRKLV